MTKACAHCGVVFAKKIWESLSDWESRRACSRACSGQLRRGIRYGNRGQGHAAAPWTPEEEAILKRGMLAGLTVSVIARQLPGRSKRTVRSRVEKASDLGGSPAPIVTKRSLALTVRSPAPPPVSGIFTPAEVRRLAAKGVGQTQIAALLRVPYRQVAAVLEGVRV